MITTDPHRPATLVALVLIAVTACRSAPAAPTPAPTPANAAELDRLARARADSARQRYTDADVQFMSGMISHHAQAIVMAGWARSHGASPAVQTLCDRIINAQKDEIATMQHWLADRHLPVPEANPKGTTMMMDGMEHTMLMPGMLTDEQMHELDQARGPDFDHLFLTYMIQHHRGAISMVKDWLDSYGAGQDELVFKLATDINVDQATEVARMQKMLLALTFGTQAQ